MTTSLNEDELHELLTAYALDALEPSEIAEVSLLLEQRPDLRAFVAELRATVDRMALGLPESEPPDDLRQRVLDHATGRVPRATSQPASLPRAVAAPVARLRGWFLGLGGLAAAALLAATLGWSQYASSQNELARVQAQQQQVIAALSQPALFTLSGMDGRASVHRSQDGQTLMVVQMPELPPGKVYQLWTIAGSAAPVSAGTFTVDASGYGAITLAPEVAVASADTMAVTAEPGPQGSQTPTMPILIAGHRTA